MDDNQATRLESEEGLAHAPHSLLAASKNAQFGVKTRRIVRFDS